MKMIIKSKKWFVWSVIPGEPTNILSVIEFLILIIDYDRALEVDADTVAIVDSVAADTVPVSSIEDQIILKTKNMDIHNKDKLNTRNNGNYTSGQDNNQNQHQHAQSIWLEAAEAELDEQDDIEVKPLEELELEWDLEQKKLKRQKKENPVFPNKRLEGIKELIKDSSNNNKPAFGLG